jgi:hypothetical protein
MARAVATVSDETDPDCAAVIELERRLLEPSVRGDRNALSMLLHEDFREVGASGRVYDRAAIIEALLASNGETSQATEFRATRLSEDVVLLTYRTAAPTHRTSVWVRGQGRWRLLHHQGTSAQV